MEKVSPPLKKTPAKSVAYLGVTRDGVKIHKPRRQPDSFTVKQARAAIAAVRQARPAE